MFGRVSREGDGIQEVHGVGGRQPVQVLGAGVVRVQVVLVALRGSFQQLGVSLPEELLQPDSVDAADRDGGTSAARHRQPVGEFGDGQHVLTGQNRPQNRQRVRGLIGQLAIVQTCG